MYLLVFVTLVVSLMSLYTQVMAIDIGRIAAQQKNLAQEMMEWHTAAVSMAASIVETNSGGPTGLGASYNAASVSPTAGCSLSPKVPATGITTFCPGPINPSTHTAINGGTTTSTGTILDAANTFRFVCIYHPLTSSYCAGTTGAGNSGAIHLSASYSVSNYQFYSFLYRDAVGSDYVVTYVPPATVSGANPTGYLTLANGNVVGFTSGDLRQQLLNADPGHLSSGSGIVKSNVLVTSVFSYTLPTGAVPTGSIALISSADGI